MTYERSGWEQAATRTTNMSLAWAAGFLEGEGSFIASSGITVVAVQVQKEPVERLQLMFGGALKAYTNNHGTLYWRWTVNGSHAVGVAYTMYGFMSPKRREQIRRLVAKWKALPGRNQKLTTHCPRGHAYTEESTYRDSRGKRYCCGCYPSYTSLRLERKA